MMTFAIQSLLIFGLLSSRATNGLRVIPAPVIRHTPTALGVAPQQLGSFETLHTNSIDTRRVVLEDLVSSNSERVEFTRAWDWQKQLLQEHVERLAKEEASQFLSSADSMQGENKGLLKGGYDTIFMLEHEAVYTLVREKDYCQEECKVCLTLRCALMLLQGTGSDEKFIIGTSPNVPVVRMDRGGEGRYSRMIWSFLLAVLYAAKTSLCALLKLHTMGPDSLLCTPYWIFECTNKIYIGTCELWKKVSC